MNSAAASRLSSMLNEHQHAICQRVTKRLMQAFPEMRKFLKLDGGISAEERLSSVSVERFGKMLQAILLFETLTIADQEFIWAGGVLPRYGVTYEHQMALVQWFFEELYALEPDTETYALAQEIEQHMLALVKAVYKVA